MKYLALLKLFLLFILVIGITSVSGQCLESERSLLLQLKEDLKFDSLFSTKLVYWNQSTEDCCKWEGVVCNISSGHIIGLELDGESIYDGLNSFSALYKFHFLQKLNLGNNNFDRAANFMFKYTKIPHALFNLTSLTYLNLSHSGFSGQISGGMSRLTRLKILDLSARDDINGNSLLKIENPNFKTIVQNLKELTELYLDGVNMTAEANSWSQAISSSLPNLRVLSLAETYISGPIHPSLQRLQFLSHIRLDGNNLNGVPEFLANLTNLKVLQLRECNLQGMFPRRILQIPTLDVLDLSYNVELQGSLLELPKNGSLHTLVLSGTKFSGMLPESISNLELLSRMEIVSSNFSGIIPKSIGNLTRLVYLDISFNKFTGRIPLFQNSKDLTYLDLSHNRLSGTIPSTYFEGLVNVAYVNMSFNMLTGKIPSSLFALRSLQQIELSNNQFSGSLPNISNASWSQMDTIDLSNNKLNGSIPMSLFELKGLHALSLSNNRLTGSLQLETFPRLENLTDLDLSYNNLLVETSCSSSNKPLRHQFSSLGLASCKLKCIPNLRNHSTLYRLDLSDNQLGGAVPSWIWKMGNYNLELNLSRNQFVSLQEPHDMSLMHVLDLHSNQLTGKIPVLPFAAGYVDYSANNFSSSIPPDIGQNLTNAFFFSLSSNKLTGTIPDSICDSHDLEVVDLSNNSLSGVIPPCLLGYGERLGVLNLGNNNLSGQIDDTFEENCSLRTLDLHANHLQGNVPKSLSYCSDLEVLNLGNNQISDTFPCFLKDYSNLRVLILRSNLFHGDTRCPQPSNHNWPKLQIMDIASNYFTGKVPHNFFFNWTSLMEYKYDAQTEIDLLQYKYHFFDEFSYLDTLIVRNKGQDVTLVKILTTFSSIDISCNQFEGNIPETIGNLKALRLLNLSHNTFTGSIPSSLGKLKQLEALDLSVNNITGIIPVELASLTFLSVLNLSYNQLTGKIPFVSQFSTFEEKSFKGNKGLCGAQVNITCAKAEADPPSGIDGNQDSGDKVIDWDMIAAEIGFSFGLGIVIMPLLFYRRWRIYYYQHVVDALLWRIFKM